MNMKKMEKRLKKITHLFELGFLQSLIDAREQELLAARECLPKPQTVFSERMIQRLGAEPMTEIFKNSTLYWYGYEHGSYKEVTLAKNLSAVYPFENISAEVTLDGVYTRFEVVSNTDLFCYMSADVGNTREYPMCVANTYAVADSTLCISNFSIGL